MRFIIGRLLFKENCLDSQFKFFFTAKKKKHISLQEELLELEKEKLLVMRETLNVEKERLKLDKENFEFMKQYFIYNGNNIVNLFEQ